MRGLRRIVLPAVAAVALGACLHPLDEFQAPASTDAGLATNGDAAFGAADSSERLDGGTPDVRTGDDVGAEGAIDSGLVAPPDTATDGAPADACTCVKEAGGKCKEWSPPGCGG